MRAHGKVLIIAAAVAVAASTAGIAVAEPPDLTVTIAPGAGEQIWEGNTATGANINYDFATGEPCIEDQTMPTSYCDRTLVHVDLSGDPDFWDDKAGGVEIGIDAFSPANSDFDLQVWNSNANGDKGTLAGSVGAGPGEVEFTTIDEADGYYLVQVAYFAVVNGTHTGHVRFKTRAGIPPEVDAPKGLQEFLASDPSKGFTSHSELHIAQNPVDPEMMVGASKFYNKDRDALAEYEFKIGTYVTFDGGGTWFDLGQVGVCPAAQAPPESWPTNTCYPNEDPNVGGTEAEDVDDPADETDPFDDRGSTDYGEEYIVSDPWVQWDDEGNAYLMVLDSPPFEGTANGWGMSYHRWESVSKPDVTSGDTWSDRIIINNYADAQQQNLALDDKNTFAVNNAGEDGDGTIGTAIACWGQNFPDIVKQQVVCERSTDGGMTWPGTPQPISGAEQLVIGVHVVGDTLDPDTFYAVWMQYATSLGGAPDTMQFTRSTDGGVTWEPDRPISTLTQIPRTFPGQSFRNLSIPIMAVGPEGEIYVVYPEYAAAPDPETDLDGLQSDISILKSTDGGLTFGGPTKVNQDTGNADQFQSAVAVTESGQVNVLYFDRRHDARVTQGADVIHPGNYFIDSYLSRSNDGGETWTDVRLSHDMWDPSINPPVSPSGEFIGDYQGLVATDCRAVPFVNDTHLANTASRDPEFDAGLPRSPYQEAFSWWVPNTTAYGGAAAQLPTGCNEPEPPPAGGRGECPGRDEVEGNFIEGTSGRDILVGTAGRDVICGGDGNDVLRGGGGNDQLFGDGGNDVGRGGDGNDIVRGWRGRDTLLGGSGDDFIHGGFHNDKLKGGGGNDRLAAAGGRDKLNGGGGRDTCRGGPGKDTGVGCESGKI
ncbi:MAG TPA: hypothetical protein VGB51_00820 [Actinomycetota bacterium]